MSKVVASVLLSVMMIASVGWADPVGWRGNGLSQYPAADPPIAWSATQPVVWKAPLPSWSNGSPVVVADRIFVTGEAIKDPKGGNTPWGPLLICVNKADGKILWQKSNGYADVMTEADKAQAAADKAQADSIRKEEMAPLGKQRKDLEAQINPLAKNKTPNEAEKRQLADLKAQQAVVDKQIAAVNDKLLAFMNWEMPGTEGSNGHTSATPVSDGKFVYVVYNTAVVACYDLEGNRKWVRKIPERYPASDQYGCCSSPVLCGNKLIVHIKTAIALDAATGDQVWQCKEAKWSWASPSVAHVGKIDVLVTGNSDIIRLTDGKLLKNLGCRLEYNSPIVVDNVAYFIQNTDNTGGLAVKLTPKGDDVVTEFLWEINPKQTKLKSDRYYASPLLLEGLIYDVTQSNVLSALDAETGKVVASKNLGKPLATVYPSIVRAGKYLFVSTAGGTTVVFEPGKDFTEVGANQLDDDPGKTAFRSTPVFEGQRLYIRAYKNLYCIGK